MPVVVERRHLVLAAHAARAHVGAAIEAAHRILAAAVVLALMMGQVLARGLTSPARARQVPVLALALGVESLLVNQGLKRLFGRPRPTLEGDVRFPVRRPSTSSFPSGHASAAAFNATLLTGWDGARTAPLWWGIGSVVAVSRAYVRIHHGSDVVAGLAVGAGLGLAARAVLRRSGWA